MTDIMSRAKRSALMSRIRGKNTGVEKLVFKALRKEGVRFTRHAANLAGRPDIVFPREKVVVFIDGDFWHGWQFPRWTPKLDPWWRKKIAANRSRDARNIARLRRGGWIVVRVWEHQVERQLQSVVKRILKARAGGLRRSKRND